MLRCCSQHCPSRPESLICHRRGLFPTYRSFLRSPIGTGLTEIRGKVEMEPCDWLLANEDVSRLSGDCGGVMRLGLLHSECEREPGFRRRMRQNKAA